MKITESAKLSFCEFLNQQRPNHPEAVVFISHAWKYRFLDVVDALRNYFFSNQCMAWPFSMEARASIRKHIVCGLSGPATSRIGRGPPDTLQPMNSLAGLYYRQGHYAKAEPLNVACPISKESHWGRPIQILSTRWMAWPFSMLAKVSMRKQSHCWRPAWSSNESHLARAIQIALMNNLALLYYHQGQYAKAELMFRDCLSKREFVLGADHPESIRTRNNLDQLRSMKKKSSSRSSKINDCVNSNQFLNAKGLAAHRKRMQRSPGLRAN